MARRFSLTPKVQPTAARYGIDYASALNPQQLAAATAGNGPILVVAGAGTGKTRTLVYRVAYLIESGIPPEHVTLLTFTRRAAKEMLARASSLLDGRCQDIRGGTFHAFCLKILRRHAQMVGFEDNFIILDSADSADVIDLVRSRLIAPQGERFPNKKQLRKMFSAATNRGQSLHDMLTSSYPRFVHLEEKLVSLRTAYEAYKVQCGLMDYDDLLTHTIRLFENHTAVGRAIASSCEHVLVDEYQDTNRLQAHLVELFSSVHGNVTVVGDDAQSIYRFRGADYTNIFTFKDRFPSTCLLKLEHNYRSTQPILDLANNLLERSHTKFDKRLFTRDKLDGEIPALVLLRDRRAEAQFVAQEVLRLREEGLDLSHMAVFFRTSRSSFELELELRRLNVPFEKRGGTQLAEAAHIKDVIAHLRVVENSQDAASWYRILPLIQGIGKRTATDLADRFASGDLGTLETVAKRYYAKLSPLFVALKEVATLDQLIERQLEILTGYYEPLGKRKYADDWPQREKDVEHFVVLSSTYRDRRAFLSALALGPIDDVSRSGNALEDDEAPLVLSTIHSAKGLEFRSVFVIRALDGILPMSYAFQDTEALDEELRLLYVAITRAEEDVIVSYPLTARSRRAGGSLTLPSRFLVDVPDKLLSRHTVGFSQLPAHAATLPSTDQKSA